MKKALMMVACLAAFAAAKNLCVSPIRGGKADSVLKLTPLELRVGAAKPFKALHISDTNLREETVRGVKAEFEKGLPVVLMCHIPPYYSQEFLENGLASKRATLRGQGVAEESLPTALSKPVQDFHDVRTRDFYNWLREQKTLNASSWNLAGKDFILGGCFGECARLLGRQ